MTSCSQRLYKPEFRALAEGSAKASEPQGCLARACQRKAVHWKGRPIFTVHANQKTCPHEGAIQENSPKDCWMSDSCPHVLCHCESRVELTPDEEGRCTRPVPSNNPRQVRVRLPPQSHPLPPSATQVTSQERCNESHLRTRVRRSHVLVTTPYQITAL